MTNKFKKQFPELWKELEQYQYEHEGEIIFGAVQKHCQSNSKVKEAIDNIQKIVPLVRRGESHIQFLERYTKYYINNLLKELNLKEEFEIEAKLGIPKAILEKGRK